MNKFKIIIVSALVAFGTNAWSSTIPPEMDQMIQEAMTHLYNVEVKESEEEFQKVIEKFPGEPLPHLFYAGHLWWRAAEQFENPESLKPFREKFEKQFEETVETANKKAEQLGSENDEICFALGGSYGLAGRWMVLDNHWLKAYNYGTKGNDYLKKALELNPELYDANLGLGIYDYYTDTMSGFFKRLASSIFLRGNKERGIQELELASQQGHFSNVEAKLFLINVYERDDRNYQKALDLIVDLRKKYPNSTLFHYTEMFLLFDVGQKEACAQDALDFIDRIKKHEGTYDINQLPLPALFLANVMIEKKDFEGALKTLNEAISSAPNAPPLWLTFCYLRRGEILDLLARRDEAIENYETVLTFPDFRNSHKRAQIHLRKPCTFKQILKSMKE